MKPLHVCLVHDTRLPVFQYGGTERILGWLAKGLTLAGNRVTLACQKGSQLAPFTFVGVDFSRPVLPQLPPADLYHFFASPKEPVSVPHVVTIHGNGQPGETFLPNTIFLSRNHAERHNATAFVYNGVDPGDSIYSEKKKGHLLFLAKASWRVKNVKGAIRIAKSAGLPLQILGGRHWLSPWHRLQRIHWRGMVGGTLKASLVADSIGLLFPVLWHEPFGVAVIEALVSGTPVLATPFGSLPELVPPQVGRLCRSEAEFSAAVEELPRFSPAACRDWALQNFDYRVMTKRYLEKYQQVLAGEELNPTRPVTARSPEEGCVLPR